MASAADPRIIEGYVPGSIGRLAELHGRYYAEHWKFGLYFEAKVATELSTFMKHRDVERDGVWVVTTGGRVEGGIVIDGVDAAEKGAHLRWFIVSDALRSGGWGRRLMSQAMGFCQRRGYDKVYLWTFEGLHAARHLYESAGFTLMEQHRGTQWGTEVNEQRFERRAPA